MGSRAFASASSGLPRLGLSHLPNKIQARTRSSPTEQLRSVPDPWPPRPVLLYSLIRKQTIRGDSFQVARKWAAFLAGTSYSERLRIGANQGLGRVRCRT